MDRNPGPNTLPDAPHGLSAGEAARLLAVDPDIGLSDSEIAGRRVRFGPNTLKRQRRTSVGEIVLNQLRSPIVLLLLAATALALVVGEFVDAAAIIAVLLLNTAIGFVTEYRAVRSMEALQRLTARSVRVRRSDRVAVIPADDLVPGDVVILEAGDVVAADMRVLAAANLASDESALTGESLPVAKSADAVAADTSLAERTSMLHKGCAVTRGTGEALVVAAGMGTELGRITKLVAESEPERSPLEHQLQRLSRDLIWITLVVAAVVAGAGILAGGELALMLETAVALAVAAIPEGLPIVATLALARGMLRMARHDALISRLSAVETLGATTVVMTDKTGTLTENRMHVDRIVTPAGEIAFHRNDGTFTLGGKAMAVDNDPDLAALLTTIALCNNASLDDSVAGGSGDPMEIALLEAAAAGGRQGDALDDTYPEVREHAFDETIKMMATVHRDGDGYRVAVKGAPEAVLETVSTVAARDGDTAFGPDIKRQWAGTCDLLAAQGLRLLAVAGKTVSDADAPPYEDLTLHGIVALNDPPRADVPDALAATRGAGVKVVMVTGDHASTARSIARSIGLVGDDATVMNGTDLKPLDDLATGERDDVRGIRLFSRVAPEQKLDLVALHQEAGEIVAMTGDGVNDAPALKKAEIGIAMGRRGTEVAREAADMVLRNDAFATIVEAIREGRIIYTNIRRFSTYLLSCNLSEILVVGLAVAAGAPLPLLPLQILFLNLVTDVFPALALGTIEAGRDVLARAPRDPVEPILATRQWRGIVLHGMTIAAVTLTALAIGYQSGLRGDEITTMCFYTLALAQLFHVFNMRNWRERLLVNPLTRNRYVWLAIVLCLVILVVATLEPTVSGALRITPLPGDAWIAIIALSIVPVIVRELAAVAVRIRRRASSGR